MKKIDYNKICNMYDGGYSVNEISFQCDCSIGTIYNILKRNNKKTRDYNRGILKQIEKEVIDRYMKNESIWHICKEMNLYQTKVKKILYNNNINHISYSKRLNPLLIENYFEKIDNPDKAYWLGWLITDGCISKGNTISLSLQKQDIYVLENIQKDLGLNNKIKEFNQNYVRFSFCCKKMVEDLSKYGIIKNKTFVVDIPKLNIELLPHLLRGCFEGDGGISKIYRKKTNKYEYELSFCGNRQSVESFNNLISLITCIKEKNIIKSNSIYRVRWASKKEIIKILEILYKNCGKHMLERKYKFINEIKN